MNTFVHCLSKQIRLYAFLFATGCCVAAVAGCTSSTTKTAETTLATETQSPQTTASSKPVELPTNTMEQTNNSVDISGVAPALATPADGKAFTDCLQVNGVTLPEGFALPSAAGQGGTPEIPAGVDLGKLQAAMAKCADKMPAAASGKGGTATAVFIACLRENGVDVAEDATLAQVPAGDPEFAAANTKCEPLLNPQG